MIHFRKAVTSEAKPLVGLYSESGCGKTKSALLIAKGFTGDMSRVGMIETESGRGEAYAADSEVGGYNVLPIRGEFSPKTYGAAIGAAEQAKFECLIVDSASHEWEGLGGVLSMASEAQAEGKKGPLVWQRAKMDHAREFMLRLTQTPIALVIVCMRAKYTMEEVVVNGKKEWQRSKTLSPKQSEDILFEMFIHGWIGQDHRFHGTKYTLDVLRQVFLDNEMITVDTGKRLAQWAKGTTAKQAEPAPPKPEYAGYTFAQVMESVKKAVRDADTDALLVAVDLGRSLPDEQQRAEIDVEARAAWKTIKRAKEAAEAGARG